MQIPTIQIRQQYAKIGIDADPGQYEIRQPRAELQIRQIPAKLEIHSPQGEMDIDQSRAWDALGVGGHLEMMRRIYSEAHQVALQGIARIVEKGNRLAAIHHNTNAIADIGQEEAYRFNEFNYAGEASFDNVDIHYTARKPEIVVHEGGADIQVEVRKPEISYTRGRLDIYLRQRNQVEIIPPSIDLFI